MTMIPKGFNKVGEKDGWEFHQATFAVMMPLGGFTPVTFTITLAKKGEEVGLHLGDSLGLSYETQKMDAKVFEGKWEEYLVKMGFKQ